MPHGRRQAFAGTFNSTANTTGQTDTLHEIPQGPGFIVEQVDFAIESGAGSNVSARVFDGETPIAPANGSVDVAGDWTRLPADAALSPGDEITVRHDNEDNDTHFDVTVVVKGEERGGG